MNHQRLEVIITPCNYVHTEVSDYGDTVPDDCETDLEKQFEYLGTSLQMSILHN